MTSLAKKVAELFGKPETVQEPQTVQELRQTEFLTNAREDVPAPTPRSRTMYQELRDATPKADALLIYPDWQGLLVKSSVLGMSVWVVRNHIDGIALAKETGHPALILDDVLKMKGRTAEEARAALLPALITLEQ